VADELHFTRAAHRLGVPQPVVSEQVRVLERRLGTSLFVRTTRSVRLTRAGEELLGRAREALAAVDEVDAVAALRRCTSPSRLTIAVEALDPGFHQHLRAALPGTSTTVQVADPTDRLDAFGRGEIDVGVCWEVRAAPVSLTPGLRRAMLVEEPLFLAVAAGHRLALAGAVDMAHLRDEVWVTRAARSHQQLLVRRLCTEAGFEPTIGYETDDGRAVGVAVAEGSAVALATPLARPPVGVVVVPVARADPRSLFVAWSRTNTADAVAETFVLAVRSWYRLLAQARAADPDVSDPVRAAAATVVAGIPADT
jgi:DNA-binding transcriptional LysR family regulator